MKNALASKSRAYDQAKRKLEAIQNRCRDGNGTHPFVGCHLKQAAPKNEKDTTADSASEKSMSPEIIKYKQLITVLIVGIN